MAFLYLSEQGSRVRKTGERIVVEKEGAFLLDVPHRKLEAILLFGNIGVTTPALTELLDHGVELAFLTRQGRLKGQLTPVKSRNIHLRIEQFRRFQDEAFRLAFGKAVVSAKIQNGCSLIRSHIYNHPEVDCSAEITEMEASEASASSATTLASLLGHEGAASRAYFQAFGKACRGELEFDGRNRHPPLDPVNAILSFGYTLVFNELQSLLDGMGFDPYLGFFHDVDYGRASLAADLVEEFRHPIVDRLTLQLINLRVFRAEHFVGSAEGEGVRFTPEALKTYFEHFDRQMTKETFTGGPYAGQCFRVILRGQAEALARLLTGTAKEYAPLRLST